MLVDLKNTEGKVIKQVNISDDIYSVPMNEHLLYLVIKAYQANKRQGTHATLTKSLISGSGKKPFRQKGTGMARQGSRQEPHMYGGAVAHGPQPRDYTQKINKKIKTKAIKIALSDKVKNQKFIIIDQFPVNKEFKTKNITNMLKNLEVTKALLICDSYDKFLYKSAKNIYDINVLTAHDFNVLDLIKYETVIVSEPALLKIEQRLIKTFKN